MGYTFFLLLLLYLPATGFSLPLKLSEAGLYQNTPQKIIAPTLRSYTPQYPLWSPGAGKRRWILLPPGTKIDTLDPDHWVFPVGTKFFKEFSFSSNGKMKLIETRVIEKMSDGEWEFGTYLWDADEQEGTLAPEDGIKNYYSVSKEIYHDIPSVTDCLKCHRKKGDGVLGFDAIQLSSDRDPLSPHIELVPVGAIFLKTLLEEERLSQIHPQFKDGKPKISATSPAARATYGYLHSNCASCHNPVGSAMQMNLNFQYKLSATEESEVPAFATSVGKRCQVFAFPENPHSLRVKPRDLNESALYHLMQSETTPHMPPLGANKIDEEALVLIRKWILELKVY